MAHHIHPLIGDLYRHTDPVPEDTPKVRGYDFNQGVDHHALLQSYLNTGFQATNFGLAVQEINNMIKIRQQPVKAVNGIVEDPSTCPCLMSCTIFLSYTSNLISCGVRESIRYLAEHKMVDILVTTAGGIEEDLIKCLGPVYVGDFTLSGKDLYEKGMNRTGNTLMPDENYTKFDKWIMPILKQMLVEQNTQDVHWTPSKMIHRLGKEINNPESVYYWAYKNNIPVFSPALTDGGIGDMFYLFSAENPGLILDIIEDISKLNNLVAAANSTGIIALGGGVAKHHICNANSWRDGADYAVYVNTAQEYDGCDSGARPDEAVSWGKIRADAKPVKFFSDNMAHHIHKVEYIYRKTAPIPEDTPKVRGYDFNQGVDHHALLQSYLNTGFQATNIGLAIQQINSMIERRQQPLKAVNGSVDEDPSTCPCLMSCTIFLSYTSNIISSGVRESIRYLAEHKMVDVLATTAGGIEEDLIKCLGPVYVGDFTLSGKELYEKGIDRIGNLLMPDENYTKFDEWMTPILEQMLLEQNTQGVHWTPSKVIHRLGKEINNPESVCYWAYKNNIPVFSPALTDGGIGDILYLFSAENPGLILDITEDISRLNNIAVAANSTGLIILGGGVAKHHICNANAWRDGADYAVYVNTAQEYDGCDSGARPDEAVSWGKIRADAKPVKVFADATIIFPLLVAETFALHADKKTTGKKKE